MHVSITNNSNKNIKNIIVSGKQDLNSVPKSLNVLCMSHKVNMAVCLYVLCSGSGGHGGAVLQ